MVSINLTFLGAYHTVIDFFVFPPFFLLTTFTVLHPPRREIDYRSSFVRSVGRVKYNTSSPFGSITLIFNRFANCSLLVQITHTLNEPTERKSDGWQIFSRQTYLWIKSKANMTTLKSQIMPYVWTLSIRKKKNK